MMQLHDKTRRRICLAAFFLLCLTPTVLVAAWCIAWQLPGHRSGEIARLRQQTGLEVALDGLEHLQPGTVLYRGLVLSDPETGAAVFRCRLLEATWTRVARAAGAAENRGPAVGLAGGRSKRRESIASDNCWIASCKTKAIGRTWNSAWRRVNSTLLCRPRLADARQREPGPLKPSAAASRLVPSFACRARKRRRSRSRFGSPATAR